MSVEALVPWMTAALAVMGCLAVIVGTFQIIRKMTSPMAGGSFVGAITALVMGGLFLVGGVSLPQMMEAGRSTAEAIGSEEAPPAEEEPVEEEPIEPKAEEPAPAAPAKPDPIVLPEVQNGGFLLLLLAGVAVVIIGAVAAVHLRGVRKKVLAAKEVERAEAARLQLEADRAAEAWGKVEELHTESLLKYQEIQSDWDAMFSMPEIFDPTANATSAMLEAMKKAGSFGRSMPSGFQEGDDPWSTPYGKAVRTFSGRLAYAVRKAKFHGFQSIPKDEKKRLDEIRVMLRLAESSGSTESERAVAYGRAMKLIRQLRKVVLPKPALAALEGSMRLSIESGEGVDELSDRQAENSVPIAL